MAKLEVVEIATGPAPELVVVWLHGLGADGHDFAPIVEELHLPFDARFVFPHAPVRAVTINGGVKMRAWYDLLAIGHDAPEDQTGIWASAAAVGELIEAEIELGFAAHRMVLAGFSQGGAIALHVGLREARRLAGILALSTYLPLAQTLGSEKNAANADLPLLMAHGTADPVIPISLAENSKNLLQAQGYAIEWRTYQMGHGVCAEEIEDISVWLGGLVA